MKTKHKLTFVFLLSLGIALFLILAKFTLHSVMANPKGIIAQKELDLIITATVLMLLVVIPVCLLTFFICLKYRVSNRKAEYKPEWDNSLLAECIWWGFPFAIIAALSYLTWTTSLSLDPYKPIVEDIKPLNIQVVALQWKWLFIYPDQKIATINYFQFPKNTPVQFDITADAPMNSFWLPQLGGQIYAMPGMRTKLHLIADEIGNYRGSSANLSGKGFAGMTFIGQAVSEEDFKKWVEETAHSKNTLDANAFTELAKPSEYNPTVSYALKDVNLFDQIIMKYMQPAESKKALSGPL